MADARLREFERRWTETRAPADEEAYLRARVTVGDLAPEMLRLAGHCGYEPALNALSQEVARGLRRGYEHIEGWAWAFEDWGREAAFRAFLALPADSDEGSLTNWKGASQEEIEEVLSNLGYAAYGAALASPTSVNVQEAVAAKVVPWALGYQDPLPPGLLPSWI